LDTFSVGNIEGCNDLEMRAIAYDTTSI
jgi:hypothetical protein